jgi:UDP-glucose 6-dehydrogenase
VKEAIELKYTHNIYHAYKVLYWNYVHEVCGNQRKIFSLYSKLTGNINELGQIYADGTPGYGGACFPKDVKAFHKERQHQLTEYMIRYNARLRADFPEDER